MPPPEAAPLTTKAPPPLKCRKGFRKKRVKGVKRCVKVRHRKHARHRHKSAHPAAGRSAQPR